MQIEVFYLEFIHVPVTFSIGSDVSRVSQYNYTLQVFSLIFLLIMLALEVGTYFVTI